MSKKIITEKYKQGSIPVEQSIVEETKLFQNISNLPISHVNHDISEVIAAGDKVDELSKRKESINHSVNCVVFAKGLERHIHYINGVGDEVIIEIEDIEKIKNGNKPAEKLFNFLMIKTNEQCTHGGILYKKYITFTLQELVNIGLYSTLQSARKGLKSGAQTLFRLLVTVKNKRARVEACGGILERLEIRKGVCIAYLGTHINWGVFAQYFTILPNYYFRLTKRAGTLLYNIFYFARQHTEDIANRGYFTISIKTIHTKLMLPIDIKNENPNRTIKKPIIDAVDEITREHKKAFGYGLKLTIVCDETGGIKNFLENGRLKVKLSGNFSENFKAIANLKTVNKEKSIKGQRLKKISAKDKK